MLIEWKSMHVIEGHSANFWDCHRRISDCPEAALCYVEGLNTVRPVSLDSMENLVLLSAVINKYSQTSISCACFG